MTSKIFSVATFAEYTKRVYEKAIASGCTIDEAFEAVADKAEQLCRLKARIVKDNVFNLECAAETLRELGWQVDVLNEESVLTISPAGVVTTHEGKNAFYNWLYDNELS